MAIVVQKYGGSSVADLTKLSRVADWVVAVSVRLSTSPVPNRLVLFYAPSPLYSSKS